MTQAISEDVKSNPIGRFMALLHGLAATLATIDGAAHFMIATHANGVAGLIARHVYQAEARQNATCVMFPSQKAWWPRYPLKQEKPRKTRKAPPFGGTFLLSLMSAFELALGLLSRVGLLALTVGILLLLTGLLSAALLLAGLLTRVLILLARVLVLVRHRGLRC
jgi:hypothetical protein